MDENEIAKNENTKNETAGNENGKIAELNTEETEQVVGGAIALRPPVPVGSVIPVIKIPGRILQ